MKPWHTLLIAAFLPLVACAQGGADPKVAASPAPAAPAQTHAQAAPAASAPISSTDPRVALAAKIPGARPEDLRESPIAGIFELTHGADISYVSADAKFIFAGDLYAVDPNGDFPNLSEGRRRDLRLKMVGAVPESQMLLFGPQTAKHTLTVFTDVDCTWCRRLHSQMADYNKVGIRVRYMFFPRSGPDTESWAKAEAVWCSADRNAALTRAKRDQSVDAKACGMTPVASQYELGREIGVTGTPGLILETGELIPGYVTPQQLIAYLNDPVGHPLR